ncbi:MAG: UDP-N-acetylmuramoyl-L-alanine--D-glutamate ligase [Treponema sp.]|jgi:UDP-N-acetylmuramoylalanine--D-glutamate ligase|nr:UDP-N-acetylmuramoyl-L-alanine--D-glutamate ligase [Treponema sp.]
MEQGTQSAGSYSGMKITVMGLGLNGGGLESARYLAGKGALVTVTDMKDEKALAPSIEQLEKDEKIGGRIRYVLGRHETEDFASADMVIKNPGVRADSPYLVAARRIETDISLFLAVSPARLIAVTGSKGKSGTASALHWTLAKARDAGLAEGKACLGGNITVSPLRFLDTLEEKDDVVLELSSWQLGDLRLSGGAKSGKSGTLKPRCAVITSIMRDHQDRYSGMEDYVNDKREIYRRQDKTDLTVAPADDEWGKSFLRESPGRVLPFSESPLPETTAGGWVSGGGPGFARLCPGTAPVPAVPADPAVPGRSQKKNLLAAALALLDLGFPAAFVRESLGSFPGIEHRLELFHETAGIRFYNDSAATIPEAAAAALEALAGNPLVLVTGGTDKNLDYAPLVEAAARANEVILLEGSGSLKIAPLLRAAGIPFHGPFGNLETAVTRAVETAGNLAAEAAGNTGAAGKAVCVVLSPGCASFGMFRNEFDRGRQWKETVMRFC